MTQLEIYQLLSKELKNAPVAILDSKNENIG